jgi:hypothetical protein
VKCYIPIISYFKVFGSKYFVLNEFSRNIKFDPKSIEGIFVGYSLTNKACKIYISSSWMDIEFVHVNFNECTNKKSQKSIEIAIIKAPCLDDEGADQKIIELGDVAELGVLMSRVRSGSGWVILFDYFFI